MNANILSVVSVLAETELTFDELATEIHKACVMSVWCELHDLRKDGVITTTEKRGQLVFSLSSKGKIFLEAIKRKEKFNEKMSDNNGVFHYGGHCVCGGYICRKYKK